MPIKSKKTTKKCISFLCPKDHSTQELDPQLKNYGQQLAYRETDRHTHRQTNTKVNTEGTLSGFQDFFLQPIIKDRPNKIDLGPQGAINKKTSTTPSCSGNRRFHSEILIFRNILELYLCCIDCELVYLSFHTRICKIILSLQKFPLKTVYFQQKCREFVFQRDSLTEILHPWQGCYCVVKAIVSSAWIHGGALVPVKMQPMVDLRSFFKYFKRV